MNNILNTLQENNKRISDDIAKGYYNKAYENILTQKDTINNSFKAISNMLRYNPSDKKQLENIDILGTFGLGLIDVGGLGNIEDALDWGINIYEKIARLENIIEYKNYSNILFNLANGLHDKLKILQISQKAFLFNDVFTIKLSEKIKKLYRELLNINYEDPMHYVNYANLLSFRVGRNYESIEFYDKALAINPNFPLALANKGETLYYLAGFNDINTTNVIIIDSHFFIKRALDIGMEAGATKHYQEIIAKITKKYQWLREYKYSPCHKSFEVFKNPFKNFHINFCHKNRLFLNPLTIEHTCPAALHDPLKMGDIAINNSVHDNLSSISRISE